MELFEAADHFGIERLKSMCEQAIIMNIDAENAAAVMLGASGRWVTAAARMGGAPRWARVMAGEEGGVAGSRPRTV